MKVNVQDNRINIPTYPLATPEVNPMFFEKRVYQGSNGKVYPVPFIDKVYDTSEDREYTVLSIENDKIRMELLPEIGGRIFKAQDKTNEGYDFFYKQDIIKPALVGLAGPWISGGVEFNWPQHHRPGTFLPCDFSVEDEPDGSKTIWMSELDPMQRMKGMHGIRLRPGSSLIELRVRLFNRTAFTQSFLWWANMAVKVHDKYQSFFPPDVIYVADHAVRAMSSFPFAENYYYGIPYHERPGSNDLRRYQNIPVPTSFMVCESDYDFFGGYDEKAQGGFIHFANRFIAPGKKQWTWGADEFGKAWDRELTDNGGPYFELMAGVYTDNQPDFSYLLPYETKSFSQFWWPYSKLGPVQNANKDFAIRLEILPGNRLDIGVAASSDFENLQILLGTGDSIKIFDRINICPGKPWQNDSMTIDPLMEKHVSLSILDSEGTERLSYCRKKHLESRKRDVAREPLEPQKIKSSSEQLLIAEHLEQYRHPTRYPEPYLKEAIEIDEFNYGALNTHGRLELKCGNFREAEKLLVRSKNIVTRYHPNPASGEALYYLGLAKYYQGKFSEAYEHFYKSTWNYEWRSAGYYQLATIDSFRGDFNTALDHLENSLDTNRQNNKAFLLKSIVFRKTGKHKASKEILERLLELDKLDQWAGFELAMHDDNYSNFLATSRNDAQTIIDIAGDYAEAGCFEEIIKLIELHNENERIETATPNPLKKTVMTDFVLAWAFEKTGKQDKSCECLKKAGKVKPDYFFPSRIFEQLILEWALERSSRKSVAAYGLGNYFYDKKLHEKAIAVWLKAREEDFRYATLHRNLGIAFWNVKKDGEEALKSYLKALAIDPEDMRIRFEYDQLRKKLNHPPIDRLKELEEIQNKIVTRDDLCVEYVALLNFCNRHEEALELLESRRFHPWEGGEGMVLQHYTYSCLRLGQKAMQEEQYQEALELFNRSSVIPENLGEKYHPLQAKAHINYWKGKAEKKLGRSVQARYHFQESIKEKGDFIAMSVSEHSEMSFYRALSYFELDMRKEAEELFLELKNYANEKLKEEARIDYFATSLPLLLVFEDDLDMLNQSNSKYLLALAEHGLGEYQKAEELLQEVLVMNAMHIRAKHFLESFGEA